MNEKVILTAENIQKSFGKKCVLSSCSLQLQAGRITGLIGPNGSGKSTFLKILLGFLFPDGGNISCLSGRYIPEKYAYGIVDTPSFYGNLSGYENIRLLCGFYSKNEKLISTLADRINLSDADLRKHVSKYSLGMKQKLAIIMALSSDRPLLILDEPTNGFDIFSCGIFNELLKDKVRRENTAVIVTSHNMEEMQKLCDSVCFLKDGKIIAEGESLNKFGILSYRFVFKDMLSCQTAAENFPVSEFITENNTLIVSASDAEEITRIIGCIWKYGLVEVNKSERTVSDLYFDIMRASGKSGEGGGYEG